MFLFFLLTRDLRDAWANDAKFCTVVSIKPNFIMPVQNFGGLPQKILWAKTCKIWPDFGRLRSSAANISETDEDIQDRIKRYCTAIPLALDVKKVS